MSDILDAIADLYVKAKVNGIPRARLYVGTVKQRELNAALSEMFEAPVDVIGGEYCGMKVVASKRPGMAIGR